MAITPNGPIAIGILEHSVISPTLSSLATSDGRIPKTRDAGMMLKPNSQPTPAGLKRKASAEDAQNEADRQRMVKRAREAQPAGVAAGCIDNDSVAHDFLKNVSILNVSFTQPEKSVAAAPPIEESQAPIFAESPSTHIDDDIYPQRRTYQPSLLSCLPRVKTSDRLRHSETPIWVEACKVRVEAILSTHGLRTVCDAETETSLIPRSCTHESKRLQDEIEDELVANAILAAKDGFCNLTSAAAEFSCSSEASDSEEELDDDLESDDDDTDEEFLHQLQSAIEQDAEDEDNDFVSTPNQLPDVDDIGIFGTLSESDSTKDIDLPVSVAEDFEDEDGVDDPRMEDVDNPVDDDAEDNVPMLPVTVTLTSHHDSPEQSAVRLPRLDSVPLGGWYEASLLGRGTPPQIREDIICHGSLFDLQKRCAIAPFMCYRCKQAALLREKFMA